MPEISPQVSAVSGNAAIEADIVDSLMGPGAGRQHALAAAELVPGSGGTRVSFEAKPDEFSPLYLETPVRSTASVNAGDYRLYVGGLAMNGAFAKMLHHEQGLDYDENVWQRWELLQYTQLHLDLLAASRNAGNAFVASPNLPAVEVLLGDLNLSAACAVAGVPSNQDVPGHESASGAVFLDVFAVGKQLLAEKNVAMLYVVGPKGEGCTGPKQGPLLDRACFQAGVRSLAKRALDLVGTYNRDWAAGALIEEVRWCLASGGVYCHPDVKKVEVAAATIHGMRDSNIDVSVTFTYDEDAFRQAFESELISANGRPAPADPVESRANHGWSHGSDDRAWYSGWTNADGRWWSQSSKWSWEGAKSARLG